MISERSPYVLGLCTLRRESEVVEPYTEVAKGPWNCSATLRRGQSTEGVELTEVSWGGVGPGKDAGTAFFL